MLLRVLANKNNNFLIAHYYYFSNNSLLFCFQLSEAESYEDRKRIRSALRTIRKRQTGENNNLYLG